MANSEYELKAVWFSLTLTNLLNMRNRSVSCLLLCRAFGNCPASTKTIMSGDYIETSLGPPHRYEHSHSPWSILNFSASRKTCFVTILGWMWARLRLDIERWGNPLRKHTNAQLSPTFCLVRLENVHRTCWSCLSPRSWGGTTSQAERPAAVLNERDL